MALLQASSSLPVAEPSLWIGEAIFWVGVVGLAVGVAVAAGVWTHVARLTLLRKQCERLQVLDELKLRLDRLVSARDDLDLRRIEHVLIDLRDGQRRLEEALLRLAESPRGAREVGSQLVPAASGDALGERVINRLFALGYARIQIVTRPEKMLEIAGGDGEVLVEARRDGTLHKGRVLVRRGALADVEIHPAYSIFP